MRKSRMKECPPPPSIFRTGVALCGVPQWRILFPRELRDYIATIPNLICALSKTLIHGAASTNAPNYLSDAKDKNHNTQPKHQ